MRRFPQKEVVVGAVIAAIALVVVFVQTGPRQDGVNRSRPDRELPQAGGTVETGPAAAARPRHRSRFESTLRPRKRVGDRRASVPSEAEPAAGAESPLDVRLADTTLSVGEFMADPTNPENVGAVVAGLEAADRGARYRLLRELGEALAQYQETSFEAIGAIAARLANGSDVNLLLRSYFRALGAINPALAVEYAGQVESRFRMHTNRASSELLSRRVALRDVVSGWAGVDPDGAARWVQQMSSASERSYLVSGVLQAWMGEEPAAATDWAISLARAGGGDFAVRTAAMYWSNRDLDSALEYVSGMDAGGLRDTLVMGLIASAARNEPEKAFALLDSVTPGDAWERAAANLAHGLARVDPEATAKWVRDNLSHQRLTGALSTAIQVWAAQDPDAAAAFVQTLPDRVLQDRLYSIAVSSLAYRNPGEAYEFATMIQDQGVRSNALDSMVRNWATRDPAAAADWAADLRDTDLRQSAYTNIALQWGRRNKNEAAEWLRSLPEEPAKYGAIVAYAAANITFPDRQTLTQWRTAMSAKDITKAEAVQWIQKTELPESVREELMRLVR